MLAVLPLSVKGSSFFQSNDTLRTAVEKLKSEYLSEGSMVGISAYDLTDGQEIYADNATLLSRPASTMKLVTAIAALANGADATPFATDVWYNGQIARDTLFGDLYVVGGFDPEFDDAMMSRLAASVAALPIRYIKGHVYGDISAKDSLYWGSGWLWDDNPEAFQPYMSPLMYNKGMVTVRVTPSAQGQKAAVNVVPSSPYYSVLNRTVSRRGVDNCKATRDWMNNKNELIVKGYVRRTHYYKLNLFSSEKFFMSTLLDRLQRRGIGCSSGFDFAKYTPSEQSVKVTSLTTSVESVLKQMMKESDNLNAEAMLFKLGQTVSGQPKVVAKDGLDAIRKLLKDLGFYGNSYRVADGCGLSHYDFLSPALLVALLKYAYQNQPVYAKLLKALPVGGVDGTLNFRMPKGSPSYGNVHAKTGSYSGINCLAGYLTDSRGHLVAFAIMNQNILRGREARRFQDAFCDLLIRR